MGFFRKKEKEKVVYDFRPASEDDIEEKAKIALEPRLEEYAKEILKAFEQGYFDDGSRDSSNPVYWNKQFDLKGPLRDKAEKIGNLKHLQSVYYRVIFLAQERGMKIVNRCMSVLFCDIDGWMD